MTFPGSANFGGMSEAQRNAIVQALLAQAQGGAPAAPAFAQSSPFVQPMDIVDPSDPASYDSSITEAVNDFGLPTTQLNPGDLIDPGDLMSPPSTLEAPAPQQQMEGLPEPDPGDPDNIGTLEAPSPSQQVVDALETQSDLADQAANTAPSVNDTFGGLAIANDITGSLADMNAAVNDAMAGYTSDPGGFGGAPGGFGTGTGFSSADAANAAVGAALGAAIDAASDSSGEAGTGEGGGSSGGGGGDGGK
jgi:hypothetical protein